MNQGLKKFQAALNQGKPEFATQGPELVFTMSLKQVYTLYKDETDPDGFNDTELAQQLTTYLAKNIGCLDANKEPKYLRLAYDTTSETLICYFNYSSYLQDNSCKQIPLELIMTILAMAHSYLNKLFTKENDFEDGFLPTQGLMLNLNSEFSTKYQPVLLDAGLDFWQNYYDRGDNLRAKDFAYRSERKNILRRQFLHDHPEITKDFTKRKTIMHPVYSLVLINDQGEYLLALPATMSSSYTLPQPMIQTSIALIEQILQHTELIKSKENYVNPVYVKDNADYQISGWEFAFMNISSKTALKRQIAIKRQIRAIKTRNINSNYPGLNNEEIKSLKYEYMDTLAVSLSQYLKARIKDGHFSFYLPEVPYFDNLLTDLATNNLNALLSNLWAFKNDQANDLLAVSTTLNKAIVDAIQLMPTKYFKAADEVLTLPKPHRSKPLATNNGLLRTIVGLKSKAEQSYFISQAKLWRLAIDQQKQLKLSKAEGLAIKDERD